MERFRELGNRPKKLCKDHAGGAFIVGLTVVLGLWVTSDDVSVMEIFMPPAAVWVITGNPYGFLIGYFALDILGDFWEPTILESMLLLGTTTLVTIGGVAARVGKLSWRSIIRNWLKSLPEEDNDTSTFTDTHQASRTVLKVAACGLFFTAIIGLIYLSAEVSSECYAATEEISQYTGVEPPPWWLPKSWSLPTQEEMEELKELAAQFVEKDPEAGRLLEAWATACRDEIAEKTSGSSSGR